MKTAIIVSIALIVGAGLLWRLGMLPGFSQSPSLAALVQRTKVEDGNGKTMTKVHKTEEEWKRELTPDQFHVMRQKGTERAFTGALYKNSEQGLYLCAGCRNELFSSDTKYESGTGWPSFWAPVSEDNIATEMDTTFGMRRIEVLCARCDAHLGHVFDDGPAPTNLRYCINSVALRFEPRGQ